MIVIMSTVTRQHSTDKFACRNYSNKRSPNFESHQNVSRNFDDGENLPKSSAKNIIHEDDLNKINWNDDWCGDDFLIENCTTRNSENRQKVCMMKSLHSIIVNNEIPESTNQTRKKFRASDTAYCGNAKPSPIAEVVLDKNQPFSTVNVTTSSILQNAQVDFSVGVGNGLPTIATADSDSNLNRSDSLSDSFRPSNKSKKSTAGKLMERLKMNFMNPLNPLSVTSTSQSMDIALSEVAFINDIDSQFGCATFYGLPHKVRELLLEHRGIKELYDWQKECLNLEVIQRRRNLIYSLPTSGGKTLVAEFLIWREVICREKDSIFILPYVSIVQEKIRAMHEFALELNFSLEEYAGSKGQFPPKKHRRKHHVYIATIEKAHSLINSLLELGRIDEIGLMVVDELHMLGENGGRGAVLEIILTKMKFASPNTMIIGMSATLGNISDIKTFLNADVYCKNFRPVELKEFVKVNNDIYSVNPNSKTDDDLIQHSRTCKILQYTSEMLMRDPDCIALLVMEVVPENSCLVFCPTKHNCENVAKLICSILSKNLKLIAVEKRRALLENIRNESNGELCPILSRTIPYGVAYHHSGLTTDERHLLEEAYVTGTLHTLCCTSTLAAGVNLPAKRVILRSPYIGSAFLTHSRIKQMIGRAGRAGIDSTGESIIIVKPGEAKKVAELLRIQVECCNSQLLDDSYKGLKLLLLSAIGLGIIKSEKDAFILISKTLLYVQKEALLSNNIQSCITVTLQALKENGLIRFCQSLGSSDQNLSDGNVDTLGKYLLEATKLGRATFKGSINLNWTKHLYADLHLGIKSLVLNTHLHLLYLVTPYDMTETISPISDMYYKAYMELNTDDAEVASLIGITEACIVQIVLGKKPKSVSDITVRRFYLSLILYQLWQQNSVWSVAEKFRVPRGHVQNLHTSTVSFAVSILHFCQELEELWAYQDLLQNFIQRLSYCANIELVPLMELPSVKRGRARQLHNAGFKDLNAIAQAKPEELVKRVEHMPRKVAKEIVEAAKVMLIKRAEELQEELEEIVVAVCEEA